MRICKVLSTSLVLSALVVLLTGTGVASAESPSGKQDKQDNRAMEMMTGAGVGIMIGGGATGFTDGDAADVADVGGSWTARVTIGTQLPIAFEAAYIGTAQDIQALGLDPDATLLSNGLEGNLRANLLTGEVEPYVFVGLGWRRYSLINESFNDSNIRDDDNIGEVPVGVGVAFRRLGFVADLRGEFRAAFDNDLIPAPDRPTEGLDLHSWNVNARLGWEF